MIEKFHFWKKILFTLFYKIGEKFSVDISTYFSYFNSNSLVKIYVEFSNYF